MLCSEMKPVRTVSADCVQLKLRVGGVGHCVFQVFADSIFHLVREKYRSLVGGCAPVHARHKSLAGIVMTRGMANFIDFYRYIYIYL